MKQPKDIGRMIKRLHVLPGNEMHQRTMRDMLEAHGEVTMQDESDDQRTIFRTIVSGRLTRWAIVAVIAVAILAVFSQFGERGNRTTVAWADVVKQFDSIAFFNASVYIKESATDQPVQVEIWRNSQKKVRIRVDKQVLFADGGEVVAGYSIEGAGRKIELEEYNETAMGLAQMLFGFQEFSLDAVVSSFGVDKQQMKETTPLINPQAMISEDMLVFDVQSKSHPQWLRIWVLRESRLPVRIRLWDPRDGECVDVVMSYSAEQAEEFFNPKAFDAMLKENKQGIGEGGRANLAYALLSDPGGRSYTPKELFEKAREESEGDDSTDISGYHLPVIEQAGVTEYGAVWIVASKSQNRRPDGRMFYGFSGVSDDGSTRYRKAYSMWLLAGDRSLNVFVPEDYPFDPARAKELILRCSVQAIRPDEKYLLIGTVKLDSWQQNTIWPQEILKKNELEVMLHYAWSRTDDRAFIDRLLGLVEELDMDHKHGHEIGKVRLRVLIKEKDYEQAAVLAEKLLPGEFAAFDKAKANASYTDFYDYIITRAANSNLEGAKILFERLKQLEPNISSYSSGAQKHIHERLARQLDGRELYRLMRPLFEAGLNVEQVNGIVGFDVVANEDTKWYVPEKYRRVKTPRQIKQEAYREKLSEYYKANPLKPGQMVFKECKLQDPGYVGPIPGVKDHYFYVFHMPLHDFMKGYKSGGQAGRLDRIFRFADGIKNPMLQHEIIIHNPNRFKWDEIREFVMSQFDLEAVESQVTETVLIAQYDGRQLKNFADVRVPVQNCPDAVVGCVSDMDGRGISLRTALNYLAIDQGLLVINNTGLDDSEIITREIPDFTTADGMKLAEQWYLDNFGITFLREQRQLPVWTIQKIKP